MSDATTRERERAAAADDSPDARARVLVDRLRAGTLTWGRAGLAAYCGDPAADSALDGFSEAWRFDLIRRRFGLKGWLKGLGRWGRETLQRAALAAGRACEAPWAARVMRDGVYTGEGWPSHPATIAEGFKAAEDALALGQPGVMVDCLVHDELPDFAYFAAMAVLGDQTDGNPERRAVRAIHGDGHPNRTTAIEVAGEQAVREAIRRSLVPWALS